MRNSLGDFFVIAVRKGERAQLPSPELGCKRMTVFDDGIYYYYDIPSTMRFKEFKDMIYRSSFIQNDHNRKIVGSGGIYGIVEKGV